MDRNIDFGTEWAFNYEDKRILFNDDDGILIRQLKFFYQKDLEKKYSSNYLYIKAFYLHHLLDYFKETRFDISNLDLVFKKFLQEKVVKEFIDECGKRINFQNELNDTFLLLKENREELYNDLQGEYLMDSKKKDG
ncbi:MAG: hypothetical protein ACFE8J_11680 [Candidatus Heimdallarchaeota archaeon]